MISRFVGNAHIRKFYERFYDINVRKFILWSKYATYVNTNLKYFWDRIVIFTIMISYPSKAFYAKQKSLSN